jgi:hypothetical protein
MQCPNCSGKKPLNFQRKDPSFDGPFPSCKQCGALVSRVGFFQCATCKFVLCQNCKICRKNHLLQKVFDLSSFGYPNYKTNNYCCDGCGSIRVNFKEIGVYHCRPCRFDLCDKCVKTPVSDYPPSHKDSVLKSPPRSTSLKAEKKIDIRLTLKEAGKTSAKIFEQQEISEDEVSMDIGMFF